MMILTLNADRRSSAGPAGGNPLVTDRFSEQVTIDPVTGIDLETMPEAELTDLALKAYGDQPGSQGPSVCPLSRRVALRNATGLVGQP